MKKRYLIPILILFFFCSLLSGQSIKSPEETFGFKMGTDRKLINWDQIVSYFDMLGEKSDRVEVVELGKTTLDRPMIMAIISSPEAVAHLDKYRKIQKQIARPFDLEPKEAHKLIKDGKLVFIITLNIHSTEIASSQESAELAYELAISNEPKIRKILDNVIILLVPSLNPDGQDLITKWYLQDVGTEYEGSRMPMKYHFYADHDNNRDWFFFNLQESRHVAKPLYHNWYPEIVMDQHQMGSRGARLFLPPYSDPVNPNVAPSLMANVNMLGKHVVADLHDQGFRGVVTNTIFNAFFEGTMSKTPLWHNRIGILTEAASVRIASPLFFPKTSLRGMGLDLPEYAQQTNFLDPWQGGWWRLRDIIEYEKAATYSMLELASTYKEKFKQNFYRLNKAAIEQGEAGGPFAFVIPREQHDPNNTVEMLKRLRIANVDVYRAESDFKTDSETFKRGDFIVPLAQPTRAYIKDLMEIQAYPNLREYPGGPPRLPYDVTAWTLPYQFGVNAIEVSEPFDVPMQRVEPKLNIDNSNISSGWIGIERRYANSYKLVNGLLKENYSLYSLRGAWDGLPPGTFVLEVNSNQTRTVVAKANMYDIPLKYFGATNARDKKKLKKSRVAIYQPWVPWVYDEGWLRLVLDNFKFGYTLLHNEDFKKESGFSKEYDVLIFGSQGADWIVNGKSKDALPQGYGEPKIRKKYTGGIGKDGVQEIRKFMEAGGTAMFFGSAVDFAIDELHLPAVNTLKKVNRSDYFAPGSLFELQLDKSSPLTYGLPHRIAVYKNQSLVLDLLSYNREITEVGTFGSRHVLLSGWAVGEERLHNKIALAEIPVGKGRAILYAFRPQHRGQTYGTFKLIFNALYK